MRRSFSLIISIKNTGVPWNGEQNVFDTIYWYRNCYKTRGNSTPAHTVGVTLHHWYRKSAFQFQRAT